MSLPAMSFGDRFCISRKGGTGGGVWVHPRGTNSAAMSGLSFRNTLVGTGWTISLILCTNRLENSPLTFDGPHFLQRRFFAWLQAKSCDYCRLINGWMWFESQKCREWLQGHLCEVWGSKKTWRTPLTYRAPEFALSDKPLLLCTTNQLNCCA